MRYKCGEVISILSLVQKIDVEVTLQDKPVDKFSVILEYIFKEISVVN